MIRAINLIVIFVIALLALRCGQAIPVSEQLPLFDALRETASIVFTVMGIWIAILVPGALNHIFKGTTAEGADGVRLQKLKRPLFYSIIVIAAALVISIANPVLCKVSLSTGAKIWVRGALFAFICILAYLQIISLMYTVLAQEMISLFSHLQEKGRKVLGQYRRDNQTSGKSQ